MSKDQEIAILKTAIFNLGSDSYLGPWLQSVIASAEHDMRSDFRPTITIPDCKARCVEMITEAESKAKGIIQAAQDKATLIHDRAEKAVDNAASSLRDALRTLQS